MSSRGLARRGEAVARIVYGALEVRGRPRVFRFHLNGAGHVIDYESEGR